MGMRKEWSTTTLMANVQAGETQLLKAIALRGKDIGQLRFQGIAPAHSGPGEYPAEQSGSAKQAMDAEVKQTMRGPVARIGYYGSGAQQTPPGGETPVGEYMHYQATGAPSINLDPRPWHLIILEQLEAEKWDDLV